MIIRKALKKDITRLVEMGSYCFNFPYDDAFEWVSSGLNLDDRLVSENEDGIVTSAVRIRPYEVYMDGSIIKMGGIADVVSMPEYRYGSTVSTLMKASIVEMKKRDEIVSILAPFKHSFYRRYGWEMTFQQQLYKIKTEDLKKFARRGNKYVPLNMAHLPQIKRLYNNYASKYNGIIKRNDKMWEERFGDKEQVKYGIADENDKLTGYIFFQFHDKAINTEEIIASTPQARNDLLGFIYMHNAQRDEFEWYAPKDDTTVLLLDKTETKIQLENFMMSRIIDLKAFMEVLTFSKSLDFSFVLKVDDPDAAWNDIPYNVAISDGKAILKKTDKSPDLTLSIQDMSRMGFGFISFDDLMNLGTAKIAVQDIENLSAAFPRKATHLLDHF